MTLKSNKYEQGTPVLLILFETHVPALLPWNVCRRLMGKAPRGQTAGFKNIFATESSFPEVKGAGADCSVVTSNPPESCSVSKKPVNL